MYVGLVSPYRFSGLGSPSQLLFVDKTGIGVGLVPTGSAGFFAHFKTTYIRQPTEVLFDPLMGRNHGTLLDPENA